MDWPLDLFKPPSSLAVEHFASGFGLAELVRDEIAGL